MLSRKHYQAIAGIINDQVNDQQESVCQVMDVLAGDLADYFKEDNPRFDSERFMEACFQPPQED